MLSAAVARTVDGLTHSNLLSLYAAGKNEKNPQTQGALSGVDTQLRNLYALHPTGVNIGAQDFGSIETNDGNPGVMVHTTGSVTTLVSGLEKLGLSVTAVNQNTHTVDGFLPLSSLVLASKLAGVNSISAIDKVAVHDMLQGDEGTAADQAADIENITNTGYTGVGVKIGVISDSVNELPNGLSQSVASGDLPNNVHVIKDGQPGDTDEGRAMLEELYDMVPGATFYFYSGDPSQDAMATGIGALKTAGCNIIVDDLGYNDEPMFQDGVVSKAINTFVAGGGSYFSAIGNDGNGGYLHTNTQYTTTSGQSWVNWAGNGQVAGETLSFASNAPIDLTLQWDNSYNGDTGTASADLDVFIYQNGKLVTSSTDDNIASGIPEENLDTIPAGTYQMKIQVAALSPGATPPDMIKFVDFDDSGSGLSAVEYTNATGFRSSAFGHGSGQNTISVGAVEFASAPPFSGVTPIHNEDYSSTGPVIYAFDANGNKLATPLTLDKPDVSGIDGINTSFFGDVHPDDPTLLPQFYGTSAAAPNVAAIAAVIDQAHPGTTQAQILAALEQSTTPLNGATAGTWDPQGGFGLVDAVKALDYFNTVAVAPTVTLAPVTTPRITPVDSEVISFSEPVTGFTLASLSLKLGNGPDLLTGSQTLTTSDNQTFTLNNLTGITTPTGTYTLTLNRAGITGDGLALGAGATVRWTTTAPVVPTVVLAPINSPVNGPISNETITFNEAVTGFSRSSLTLTRNGGSNLLTSTQALTTTDQTTYILSNLSSVTAALGTYTLTLNKTGISSGGLALAANATVTWTNNGSSAAPTVMLASVATPRTSPLSSETITFNEPVAGLTLSSLSLSKNLGANLLTSAQTLTTSDDQTYTLGNLSGLTSTTGSYVLTLDPTGITGTGGTLATGATVSWQMTASASLPSVSIADASVTKPATGTTLMNFNVTLSAASTSAVVVHYATVAGTASSGNGDYTGVPAGTLTIPAGQTTGTISITIKGSTTKNAPRTFTVDLTSATGANISDGAAAGTILSTTSTPSVVFPATTSFVASTTATTTLSIPVTLSQAATSNVTINFTTVAGTASSQAGDYVGISSGSLTILAGQTTGHVLISVKAHPANTHKTFSVSLTSVVNATFGNKVDTITLT